MASLAQKLQVCNKLQQTPLHHPCMFPLLYTTHDTHLSNWQVCTKTSKEWLVFDIFITLLGIPLDMGHLACGLGYQIAFLFTNNYLETCGRPLFV